MSSKKLSITRIVTESGESYDYPNKNADVWKITISAVKINTEGNDDNLTKNSMEFYYSQKDLEKLGLDCRNLERTISNNKVVRFSLRNLLEQIIGKFRR